MTQSQMNLYLADVQIISAEFYRMLRYMELTGKRLGGRAIPQHRPIYHSIINNFFAFDTFGPVFGTDYYRCLDQAEEVVRYFHWHRSMLNLEWRFIIAHAPGHYWAEAIPVIDSRWEGADSHSLMSYLEIVVAPLPEGYKILVLDPWKAEISVKTIPSSDILHWGDGGPDLNRQYF